MSNGSVHWKGSNISDNCLMVCWCSSHFSSGLFLLSDHKKNSTVLFYWKIRNVGSTCYFYEAARTLAWRGPGHIQYWLCPLQSTSIQQQAFIWMNCLSGWWSLRKTKILKTYELYWRKGEKEERGKAVGRGGVHTYNY